MTLTGHVDPAESRQALHRRTLGVVMASQVFSGAGLAAGATVGPLLAGEMLGTSTLAGVPSALFTAGSAAAALGVGSLSQRLGRRVGLTAGYAAGALGSAGVVAAAAVDNVALLLLFLFVYGAGTATNLQARYAGADLAGTGRRGRAVSSVLLATTVGAVIGPNLVAITGRTAAHWHIPALAGPFALAALAYAVAGTILSLLLRPDPLLTSRALPQPPSAGHSGAPAAAQPATPALAAGAATMILTQLVMVAVMTMTPVHMTARGHDLAATGLVTAAHIAAMYLPSPISGILVDHAGRVPVAIAAGVTLLAAGAVCATAPEGSVTLLTLALGLLGLGWNLGLVAGTAMITDAAPPETRAKTQGTIDLHVALAGTAGGIASGPVTAAAGYGALALGGGLLALTVIPFLVISARRTGQQRPRDAAGVSRQPAETE